MDIDLLSNIFYAMVRCGTPLLLVALGELICEKSGVINLGQEGMMLFGAVIGFIVALNTGNLWLGVLLAMLAGMLLSALFALVALVFNANQVATGLALTKLDGTAKGGVIFALAKQFGLPIRYIGVGEGIDDLRTFEAEPFVQALFAERERP